MPPLPNELLNVLLQQLQQSAQRRPDLIADPRTQRVATYMGRVVTPEDTPTEVQRRFPQAELETGGMTMQAGDLLKGIGLAGMAKQFKSGPNTLEALIANLVKKGEALPYRSKLLPALATESGEHFVGRLGGMHPFPEYEVAMRTRGGASSMPQWGYKVPYEGSPFIQESIANYMGAQGVSNPERVQTVNNLINKGISLDTIISLLK